MTAQVNTAAREIREHTVHMLIRPREMADTNTACLSARLHYTVCLIAYISAITLQVLYCSVAIVLCLAIVL